MLLAALLTGCGGTDDATGADGTSTTSATSGGTTGERGDGGGTTSTAPDAASSSPSTTAAHGTDDGTDIAACVVNTWTQLADQVEHLFTSTPMSALPGFEVSVTGEGTVEIAADGTYRYEPHFSITESVNGVTGSGEWGGTLTGTWSVEGDQLTMRQVDNGITGSITIMGQTVAMPTNRTFDGTATVTDCQPMTITTRIATPTGDFEQTLVSA